MNKTDFIKLIKTRNMSFHKDETNHRPSLKRAKMRKVINLTVDTKNLKPDKNKYIPRDDVWLSHPSLTSVVPYDKDGNYREGRIVCWVERGYHPFIRGLRATAGTHRSPFDYLTDRQLDMAIKLVDDYYNRFKVLNATSVSLL